MPNRLTCAIVAAAASTVEVFERPGVFSLFDDAATTEIYTHSYVLSVGTEAKLTVEIGRTLVLPAAYAHARDLAAARDALKSAGGKSAAKALAVVAKLTDELSDALDALEKLRTQAMPDSHVAARHTVSKVVPAMLRVRAAADSLEEVVADAHWPLPTYQELLFLR